MSGHSPTQDDTTRLALLVEQRLRALRQLRDLCERQRTVVASSDSQRLLKVLAAKQRLIAALQAIEEGLDPFRAQDPDQRRWASATAREDCQRQLTECEAIWAEIMELEGDAERALQEQRARIAEQLQQAGNAIHAHTAYARADSIPSVQLDLQSE